MIHDQFSIDSYKIFNTVAETGSITKAAAELFISQPAVSKAIQKLEHSLSSILFIRNARGVRLTNEGKILYEYTSSAFSKLREGEKELRRFAKLGTGHIRIGTSTTLCKYLLLPKLKEYITLYPQVRLTIQCQSASQTMDLLTSGKIDVSLTAKPSSLISDYEFFHMTEIEDIFAASPSYLKHLEYPKRADIKDGAEAFETLLATGCLMLLDEENVTRKYIDHYFNRLNHKAFNILEVNSMDLLIEFAKIGLGTACVVQSFIEEELKTGLLVKIDSFQNIKKRKVGFITAASLPSTEYVSQFIQFCTL